MKNAFLLIMVLVLISATFLSGQSLPAASQQLIRLLENGDTAGVIGILEADPQNLKADLEQGMTPLHYSAYYGNATVFDYMIKHGADLHARDRRGLTPVWFTISGSRPAMLRKLIDLGADLSVKNANGDNLLFRAAMAGNTEVIGILLDKGFDPTEKNKNGITPVIWAASANSVAVMNQFVSWGVDLQASSTPQFPLLHSAVMGRGAEVVHYLIDRGFDVNLKNNRGVAPLTMALDAGNLEAARALILRGADVDAANADGTTPLQTAVKKGASELVGLLIARKADVKIVEEQTGKTMLHEAALRGNSAIVGKLLETDIDKNARDKNGHTALSYALKYGNRTAADRLRRAGAEEVPWETNLDDSAFLNENLAGGQAYIWYLRHSGWALKTKSAFLIFDYWQNDPAPDEQLLANGHVRPEEIKDLPVYVFISHEHGDHFDRQILDWKKTVPNITYIFGFEPNAVDGVVTLGPRMQKTIGPLKVTTIQSNDAGVGFAVQVDGLTIFHAGDHANGSVSMEGNNFFPEIDFLAEKGIRPDISFFLNMYGCGSSNPEAFQKGIFYSVDKLKIKSVLPMHGADREWVYQNLAEAAAKNKIKVDVGAAVNQGDRFFFSKGALKKS
jgi:ankyrin repeat protein